MRLAVLSVATSVKELEIFRITKPFMEAYCRKNGFNFVPIEIDGARPELSLTILLRTFDRVLYLAPWMLVRFDCPDIFKIVPEHLIGQFDESDCYPKKRALSGEDRIYNGDVIVAGQGSPKDTEIFPLPHRFNRLPITVAMTGEWFPDSYIANCKELSPEKLQEVARMFEKCVTSGVPPMPKRINIDMPGALGDCVAMEPIVRYINNVLEPEAKVTVRTAFPEVFEHLISSWRGSEFRVISEAEDPGLGFKIDLARERPGESFNMMHPLDYGALNAFGGTVPKEHRNIHLRSDLSYSIPYVSDSILIHPGRTWQSRTFPASWWQNVIDELLKDGHKLAIIGKDIAGGTRGTVEGLDVSRCDDLRNTLNLKQLINVIFSARMLITNDSSPVHISGASQTPTILINSCKHADFIWPRRSKHLNITLGRPIAASTPRIGLVNSTRLDTCEPSELEGNLPKAWEVAGEVRAYFGR